MPANTCPECGRAFDPTDNSTFATSLRRLIPKEALASITCSLIYFVALYVDSQPSAKRGIDHWYFHGVKFVAFIILFGISIGLLLAVIRLKRWIAASLGSIAVLVMVIHIVRWVQGFLPYWF
ncbi:MAG: hypothetical protein IH984_12575 [Planctomycetes bacterium]|nr:hypothetical protein [Planctomycetota bacterium]